MAWSVVDLDGWRKLTDPIGSAKNYAGFIANLRNTQYDPQKSEEVFQCIKDFFQKLTGYSTIELVPRGSPRL